MEFDQHNAGNKPESKDVRTEIDWLEPFEWQEPGRWQELAANPKALAELMLNDQKIHAALMLLANRERAKKLYPWHDGLHTPPAAEHYRHTYLWDSGFCQTMYAQAAMYAGKAAEFLTGLVPAVGNPNDRLLILHGVAELTELSRKFQRAGIEEGFTVVKGQKKNGFIANLQYGKGVLWYEIEKLISLDRKNKTSNYTQPPVLPLAVLATYKSMRELNDPDAKLYLEEMYGYQDRFMRYFHDYRSNGAEDKKIGVIEHHETGMDSSPQWDYDKALRKVRQGADTDPEQDEEQTYLDGTEFVLRQLDRLVYARGNLERMRKFFWNNDMAMNGIYLHNIQAMIRLAGELGREQDVEFYMDLSEKLQAQLIDDMWQEDPDKVPMPGFYSLRADGEPVPTITISNLFGLVLPKLPEDKLEAVLSMMDEHFDTPYPLPSVSTKSPSYDPNNQEKDRLWRGPTWINTNYYLVEFGLKMQAGREDISPGTRFRCKTWANRISRKSNELLDKNEPDELQTKKLGAKVIDLFNKVVHHEDGQFITGAWEHYNPHTGEGQRDRVRNFAWSWLARFMDIEPDLDIGLSPEDELELIVNSFGREVIKNFVEIDKLATSA